MKTCKTCGLEKGYDEFYANKQTRDGRASECKNCVKARTKRNSAKRKANEPPKPKKPRMQGFRKLPEGKRKCGKCSEVKDKSEFYADKRRASGVAANCKACILETKRKQREDPNYDHLTYRRKWREENREHIRRVDRKWRETNREKNNVVEARRRARKKSLPDTLTHEEADEIVAKFNGKCAICDSEYEHLDHFIPLATGHGGTVKENMVPLCKSHNLSKNARNPFAWAGNYLSECERGRFDALVSYLTEINGIAGVENYKAHVYQCFK